MKKMEKWKKTEKMHILIHVFASFQKTKIAG